MALLVGIYASSCRPTPSGDASPRRPTPTLPGPDGSCDITTTSGGERSSLNVSATVDGRTLQMRRMLSTTDDVGVFEVETELKLDGTPFVWLSSSASASTTGVSTRARVHGVNDRSIQVELTRAGDSQQVAGSIDGKAIVPFTVDPDASHELPKLLADGGANPLLEALPIEDVKLAELLQALLDAAKRCVEQGKTSELDAPSGEQLATEPPHVANVTERALLGFPTLSAAPVLGSVKGHDSETNESGACLACKWVKCEAKALVCMAGLGGLWSLLVDGKDCVTKQIACIAECYHSGNACCPKVCRSKKQKLPLGGYGYFGCCDDNETCLNSNIGTCCKKGTTPCSATECCTSGETCNTAAGRCCPAGTTVAGAECCPNDTTVVLNGACCKKGLACGSVCCPETSTCGDASKGLCCPFYQPFCAGKCCPLGGACIGGACCPAGRACGSKCCGADQECRDGKCAPRACGPGLHACSLDPKICCPTGQECCGPNGACVDVNHCIH